VKKVPFRLAYQYGISILTECSVKFVIFAIGFAARGNSKPMNEITQNDLIQQNGWLNLR